MLVVRESRSLNVLLCREHAFSAGFSFLGSTLVLGWWGVISFFVNFLAVAMDLQALCQALFLTRAHGVFEGGHETRLDTSTNEVWWTCMEEECDFDSRSLRQARAHMAATGARFVSDSERNAGDTGIPDRVDVER